MAKMKTTDGGCSDDRANITNIKAKPVPSNSGGVANSDGSSKQGKGNK